MFDQTLRGSEKQQKNAAPGGGDGMKALFWIAQR
jgi:hypothetical protein